jgi:uncharacterized membrane protein YuzA (DUF378 family)
MLSFILILVIICLIWGVGTVFTGLAYFVVFGVSGFMLLMIIVELEDWLKREPNRRAQNIAKDIHGDLSYFSDISRFANGEMYRGYPIRAFEKEVVCDLKHTTHLEVRVYTNLGDAQKGSEKEFLGSYAAERSKKAKNELTEKPMKR